MNRIDRYISGLFLIHFIGGLIIFVTIFIAIDALGLMVDYKNVSGATLIAYYGFSIPEVIYRMVPVASVLSVVFTLSTLNRANELVALYSTGMSLIRICAPIIFWVIFLCFFELTITDSLLPNFAKIKNFVFFNDIKKNPSLYSTVKTDRIWYRSKDAIFYIKTLNEKEHKAQGLNLYYFNESFELLQMITAKEVDFAKGNWQLRNGTVTVFTHDSSFPLTSQFRTKTIVMDEGTGDISSSAHTSDVLTLGELSHFIKKNKEAGLDTIRYEVDYHQKISYSFAAIVMALLGIPFSVSRARSGGAMKNIGISLGLVFLFWIVHSSALTLGNYGYLPPIVSAWASILSMSAYAGWLIRNINL